MAILSQKVRVSSLLWTNLAILQVEKTAWNDKPKSGGRLAAKETTKVLQLIEWFRF
jgi:hypothetical protein